MKKWLIPAIIIAIVVFVIYSFTAGVNNTAVEKEENAKMAWANVESSYQRRNDLIGDHHCDRLCFCCSAKLG